MTAGTKLVGAVLVAARVSLGEPSGAGRTRAVVVALELVPDPDPDPDVDADAERDAERDELVWPPDVAAVRLAAAVPPHPTSAHPVATATATARITVAVAARTPSRLGAT